MEQTNYDIWGRRLSFTGIGILRYGLVFLLLMIGTMKFFQFEAEGIKPLVENSPFFGWMYQALSVQAVSIFFGIFEIIAGLLILTRRFSPRLSAFGSLMTIPMFLTTLSFLFSTPGALDVGSEAGGFLMKDLILLGAGVATAGEALLAAQKNFD